MRAAASQNVLTLAALFVSIFLPLSFAAAQAKAPASSNLVNCFDYYHFGSVQVHANPVFTSVASGAPLEFSGVIENQNPYPIVDGAVYVKVFRYGTGDTKNGPDVVDQFFVKDGITLAAGSSTPITFSWNVPSTARSGEYGMATFFTAAKKFNLLGLSFTDDVVGNTARFTVKGGQNHYVSFDKKKVTVNGKAYAFAGFLPRTNAQDAIQVEAVAVNSAAGPEQVGVHWQLYSWDAQLPSNLIEESDETITVPAGGTAPSRYTIRDTNAPVYLLTGTLYYRDSKSIINVRVVREGISRLRLNFPSITTFPLKQGEDATLFSCLHNTADSAVKDARLDLKLTDRKGNIIHSTTYEGAVAGAMMGVAESFVPEKTYHSFVLNAKLYSGDTLVDEATFDYDCKAIDPTLCPDYGMLYYILIGAAAVLIIGGTLLHASISKRSRSKTV
jgi:hypothetical protein